MKAPGIPTLGPSGTGLSQHARLVTLVGSRDGGLPAPLAAERFEGREALNELFCFDVDALSTSTDLDVAGFLGEEFTLTLLQPDGSRRAWHGLCTGAAWSGADGGLARYRLRLEPALALLARRRDSYIFQDRNARDIVTELLADYPQVQFDFDLTQALPTRPICTQYRESDLEFFMRLLASEGLSWRFEHQAAGDAGPARHRLVIFDSRARAPATPGGDVIRFHGVRATERDDAIDGFGARRRLAANAVSIGSWDPAQLVASAREQRSNLEAGAVPTLWLYDGSGERIATARQAADTHSESMLLALEAENKVFEGSGAARRLAAGCRFQLTQHDRYPAGENAFTVLWVRHEARNNLDAGIAAGTQGALEKGSYRNSFGCVRDTVAIVPALTAQPHAITAPGPQCARVVGLANSVATTTRDHQVRIQFAWQRGTRPHPGGLAHDTDRTGCAPGDERSGTWVRVAEALAGPNWGTLFTPRVGTEVLVDFIEGDIDRPVIVSRLFTGSDLPPFAAGVDSGLDHPGTLSGIHSHNFDGSGFNGWQLDDTAGQVRTRLATSTAATQLNLGYLIEQSPGSARRGAYRGSGFELRTDAWATVRGGEGVLLSTSARAQQGCGVASTQMDAAGAVSLLEGARALGQTLGDAAAQQQALFSRDAAAAQSAFIDQVDPKEKGKYGGAVNGQPALKAGSGSRELDAAQPVEKFGAALVLMDAAAAINWATPASTVIHAGQHLHWTTQSDLQMTAAHTVSSAAAHAATLFAHGGGIQAIAANGPVSLQAHTDGLEILADKEITVMSVNDCIEIKAREKIVLQAGQSAITLDGGDITFACPGKFSVKGGRHVFDSGEKQNVGLARLPDTRVKLFSRQVRAINEVTGEAIPQLPYKIETGDGDVFYGETDENGKTVQVKTISQQGVKVSWGVLPPVQDRE